MKKMRLLAIALIAVLLLACVAACGGNGDETDTTVAATDTSAPADEGTGDATEETTDQAEEPTKEDKPIELPIVKS